VLEGLLVDDIGGLNRVLHLWSFNDLNERDRLLAELGKNQKFQQDYLPKARPLMLAQENSS